MEIKCPHCNYVGFPNEFPDLYVKDTSHDYDIHNQVTLLNKMQRWGFNVVTCPMCGYTLLHETEVT